MGDSEAGGDWLDLADAIGLLRDQIQESLRRTKDPDVFVLFTVGEVVVDFEVELSRTRGISGEARFGVVAVDGKRDRVSRATHRVSITMQPKLAGNGDVDISAEVD